MLITRTIGLTLLAVGMSLCGAAQSAAQTSQTPAQTSQTNDQSQPTPPPAPAFGQNAPILSPENPPVTGLDVPGLELNTASRSFVSPALQVSESADTNGGNQLGNTGLQSISRVIGAFDLQQFSPRSDLLFEYVGGAAFYGSPYDVKQIQAAGLEAKTRWRTGQATLRDSFEYLPDGSFQIGTFGGLPGLGLATGSTGSGLQGGDVPGSIRSSILGSIGNISHLSNNAIADVVQAINPVSAVTLAGAFSNVHFFDPSSPPVLINGDQFTAQGGYSHLLNRHDQIGVVYGFQLFQFPEVTGGQIYNHIVNIRYSHSITGRLSFVAGVGPQYTDLQENGDAPHWSVSGRAQLRYKFAHSYLTAAYEKFTSAGSGIFAGAATQTARLGYKRPVGRTWDAFVDLGYSHNKKLQTVNLGFPANTYNEGSAGMVLRKHLGRSYDLFAAYRFSEVAFDVAVPLQSGFGTGRISQRHAGTMGIEWHPRPTRID
jgi:hypothetical protein